MQLSVSCQESAHVMYLCVSVTDFASLYDFDIRFVAVPTVWQFVVFIALLNWKLNRNANRKQTFVSLSKDIQWTGTADESDYVLQF